MDRTIKEDDDEKLDDKEEVSPWADPALQDPSDRIVGWRDGVSMTKSAVDGVIKKEKGARQEYRRLRKIIAKHRGPEEVDPMKDLPPTWKAFWSSVPHLNAKAAFEEQKKHEERMASKKRAMEKAAAAEDMDLDGPEGETTEEEIARLEQRVKQVKEALAEKEKLSEEWNNKIERVKKLDQEAEEKSRRVRRKVEKASYEAGLVQGKLKSSDTYFQFLQQDAEQTAKTKVTNLARSSALMDKQMDLLKGHVRLLLKDAATLERESSVAADGKSSERETVRSLKLKGELKAPPQSPSLHH
mmetsp:Transcript_78609/g.138573  ORF Transcript_78609/g.138573 Transcript_78609/m.138573 type:complete len:299 (-) Transcript_78609:42-938(-)